MRAKKLFTILGSILAFSIYAQTTFQKTLDLAQDDEFLCGVQTSDGGYIAGGYSTGVPYGGIAVKLSSNGGVQWSKSVGGTRISHLVQTNWGGYYLAGLNSVSSNNNFYLTKIDGGGNVLWSKTYGKNTEPDELHSLAQTPDGGLIMSGYADTINGAGFRPIAYVIKVDSNGVLQWSRYIGGGNGEEFYAAKPVSTGGYICAGYTGSYGSPVGTESYLVRLDNNGNVLWTKVFGHNNRFDRIYDLVEFPGNCFMVTGQGLYTSTSDNLFLAKTDTSGNFLWQKNYEEFNGAWSLVRTQDNKLVMGGYYINQTLGLYNDSYLIKTDTSGNEIWAREMGAANADDKLWNVVETADAGFFITGSTYGTGNGRTSWFVKTDAFAASGCRDSSVTVPVTILPIAATTGGNAVPVYLSSSLTVGQQTANMTGTVFCSGPTDVEESGASSAEIGVYPNPANEILNIEVDANSILQIIDAQGRMIANEKLQEGRNEINISAFTEGIYFVRVTDANGSVAQKKLLIAR